MLAMALGNISEDFQRLKILLAMATALLLTSALVTQVLADVDPLFSMLVKQLNELDPFVQGPEVGLVSCWSSMTLLLLGFSRARLSLFRGILLAILVLIFLAKLG